MLISSGIKPKLYFMLFRFSFLSFVFLFLLISVVSSLEIGMSPQYAFYEGDSGQSVCREFEVYSDSLVSLLVESRWGEKESRELGDYGLRPDWISESIIELGSSGNNKKFRYCVSRERAGKFYGVLLVSAESTPAGVGSWIEFNVAGENEENSGLSGVVSKMTGKLTLENSFEGSYNLVLSLLGTSSFFFMLLLVLLLVAERKNHHE